MTMGRILLVLVSVSLGCRAAVWADPVSTPAVMPSSSAVQARPFKPFAVYTEKGSRLGHYSPTGYMGDSDLSMSGAYVKTPHGEGPALRIHYSAHGPKGWSGISWQDPPNNWAEVAGRAGYDLRGATRLTFWARGEKGGERVQEFRVGGIVGKYPDSDTAHLKNTRLSKEWKQYTIDLTGKDLRHIISGFGFSVLKAENPGGMQFYVDDIFFEGPEITTLPSEPVASPPEAKPSEEVKVSTPVTPVPVPILPRVDPALVKDLEMKDTPSGLKVSFSSRLMFLPGQAVLESSSHKILDQLEALLKAYPTNRVLIEGHTDSTGDKHLNLRLSELRAKEVRAYLMKKGGYEDSRFQVIGYGDTKPIATNKTKAGRSENRRVEATILRSTPP